MKERGGLREFPGWGEYLALGYKVIELQDNWQLRLVPKKQWHAMDTEGTTWTK